jgi:hypothetical protein
MPTAVERLGGFVEPTTAAPSLENETYCV